MELVFAGLSDILEADAKQIAKEARETFDMYVLFVFSKWLVRKFVGYHTFHVDQ